MASTRSRVLSTAPRVWWPRRAAASPSPARFGRIGKQSSPHRARSRRWTTLARALRSEDRVVGLRRNWRVCGPASTAQCSARRLQRIVSAHAGTRVPPRKQNGARRIEQAQLAHRVGDIDGGSGVGICAGCAPRDRARAAQHRDIGAARGMARHDDGEQIGKSGAQRVVRRQNGFVLAGMGLAASSTGRVADGAAQ